MKNLDLEQPMLRLNFGGYGEDILLPWKTGIAVLNLLRDSIRIQQSYADGETKWVIKKDRATTATSFTPEETAQLLMTGSE